MLCMSLHGIAQMPQRSVTSFVDCSDAKGNPTLSNKVQTSIVKSKFGARAFAVVSVEHCQATAMLYVARPGESFRLVRQVDGKNLEGNGVGDMFWSPSQQLLAVDFTHWSYASDASIDHELAIYDVQSESLKELPLSDSGVKLAWGDCDGELSLAGWLDEKHLRLHMVRYPFVGDDQDDPQAAKLCRNKPFDLSYEIATGKLALLAPKPRH